MESNGQHVDVAMHAKLANPSSTVCLVGNAFAKMGKERKETISIVSMSISARLTKPVERAPKLSQIAPSGTKNRVATRYSDVIQRNFFSHSLL